MIDSEWKEVASKLSTICEENTFVQFMLAAKWFSVLGVGLTVVYCSCFKYRELQKTTLESINRTQEQNYHMQSEASYVHKYIENPG